MNLPEISQGITIIILGVFRGILGASRSTFLLQTLCFGSHRSVRQLEGYSGVGVQLVLQVILVRRSAVFIYDYSRWSHPGQLDVAQATLELHAPLWIWAKGVIGGPN